MINNFLKTAWRNFWKSKGYAAVIFRGCRRAGQLQFVPAALLVLGVAALTVSIHTLKAASAKPAVSLRDE